MNVSKRDLGGLDKIVIFSIHGKVWAQNLYATCRKLKKVTTFGVPMVFKYNKNVTHKETRKWRNPLTSPDINYEQY